MALSSRRIIIFDFEVFRKDILLGAIIVEKGKKEIFQTWSKEEIKGFYDENKDFFWIGHNNEGYDNFILDAVLSDIEPYPISKSLIHSSGRRKCQMSHHLYYIDLMKIGSREPFSLKMTEAASGNDISETEISFDIDRSLSEEEKQKTESYNRDDLRQTYENFISLKDEISLRFDLCREFQVPISHICDTESQLAAIVLGAKKNWGIENPIYKIKPHIYSNLEISNDEMIRYFLDENDTKPFINIKLCGLDHQIAKGGIHAGKERFHCDKALYFDVSGYYNRIMINYDLLPRTLDEEGKKKYVRCFDEEQILKKTNPRKRKVYKKVLLAVFGSEKNKFTDFYDPYKSSLVFKTSQAFLVDLLEKLEGKVEVIQSNTDGIIARPLEGHTEEEMLSIISEWESRTGFLMKKIHIYDIWQRDVNCYMYRTEDGKINVLGENGIYEHWQNIFDRESWRCKEPPIIAYCIVDYLENNIPPEDTVKKYSRNLRLFQYLCKKGNFDYMIYEKSDMLGPIERKPIQNINRAFAFKSDDTFGMVYKCRNNGTRSKVTSLPDNVFIYNDEILSDSHINEISPKIDYDYYVKRAYEKISTFYPKDKI